MIAWLFAWWLTPLVAPSVPTQNYRVGLTSYTSFVCAYVAQRSDGSFPFPWALAWTPDETVTADGSHLKLPSLSLETALTVSQRALLTAFLTARGADATWVLPSTTQRQAIERIGRWHERLFDVSKTCGHP